jgi:subtilisin family serine protease
MPGEAGDGRSTGRGVRIAIIDSGVFAEHPHVGGVAGGFAIDEHGALSDDYVDRLGHGTAVAAAIREKAPGAELLAVKVFARSLATDVPTLVHAIDEAAARGATVINLSLGTPRQEQRDALAAAVARAAARGAFVVSAARQGDVEWLPGSLDTVVGVRLDWDVDRTAFRIVFENGRSLIATSGYPREIPGIPRDRNLKGISFAVANATGFVARAIETDRPAGRDALFAALSSAASVL